MGGGKQTIGGYGGDDQVRARCVIVSGRCSSGSWWGLRP
jgi:hypothetical protein